MDSLLAWTQLTDDQRTALKKQFHAAGISITFSCFGSLDDHTSNPSWADMDPVAIGQELIAFAHQYQLDGLDIEFEDMGFINSNRAATQIFLTTLYKTVRQGLPRPFRVSASCQVLWFVPGHIMANDSSMAAAIVDDLDWLSVMYCCSSGYFETCENLAVANTKLPGSAIAEIEAQGVIPSSKLVVSHSLWPQPGLSEVLRRQVKKEIPSNPKIDVAPYTPNNVILKWLYLSNK